MILISTTDVVVEPGSVEVPESGAQPQTTSMTWTWTAPWLGRTWVLTDPAGSVLKLEGATLPEASPTHWWSEAPTVDGSNWEGMRAGRDEAFIPVWVEGATWEQFRDTRTEFMASLDPAREGVLRVTQPDGVWREIPLRYENGKPSQDLDVALSLYDRYAITWSAGDPYWRGAEVTRRYSNDAGAAFFPGTPFTIGPGLTLQDPTIVNPGDVEAYPVWRVEGPFAGFSVGVGDSLVEMTLTRSVGQFVEIDMSPRRLTILDETGADRWDYVTEVAFSAIPAGATQLSTLVVGASSATAIGLTFTPRYRRAW